MSVIIYQQKHFVLQFFVKSFLIINLVFYYRYRTNDFLFHFVSVLVSGIFRKINTLHLVVKFISIKPSLVTIITYVICSDIPLHF